MQGSLQKRKADIALWEMDQPVSRPSRRKGKRRPGDVDIIDLYPGKDAYQDGRYRGGRPSGSTMRAEPVRKKRYAEPIGYSSRNAEPIRRKAGVDRTSEPVGRRPRTVEPIEVGRRRMEEPVRRRRVQRPATEDWDVEIIGQDWIAEPYGNSRAKVRKKAKQRRGYLHRTIAVCTMAFSLMIAYMAVDLVYDYTRDDEKRKPVPEVNSIVVEDVKEGGIAPPAISEDFLNVNDFSRPGTTLPQVNSIFVHYTANPGTSAAQNRSYFANLAETQERSASAHFIIGYEGEIIQCMPLNEQAYAVMTRNEDSISIECCYLDKDGQFTQETYDSLVHLLAWLQQEYHLGNDDILRHYDCGGKKCPVYYVDHEEAWEKLLADVEIYKTEHT